MNPASRIFNIVSSLNKITNKTTKLSEAYKDIFVCDTILSVYKALILFDNEVSILENIFISSNKQEKYKSLIKLLRKISIPLNLDISLASLDNVFLTILPKLDVLSDALELHSTEEVNISEQLNPILNDIDSFMQRVLQLDIDEESKITYLKVTSLLKESITHYHITGTKEVNYVLRQFKCLTNDIPEAQNIYTKISTVIADAANLSTIIGFTAGSIITPLIGG